MILGSSLKVLVDEKYKPEGECVVEFVFQST